MSCISEGSDRFPRSNVFGRSVGIFVILLSLRDPEGDFKICKLEIVAFLWPHTAFLTPGALVSVLGVIEKQGLGLSCVA